MKWFNVVRWSIFEGMKKKEDILNGIQGHKTWFGRQDSPQRQVTFQAMEEYADQFKPKWISTEERLPLCYQRGKWDGERSDIVAFKDEIGNKFIGRLYSGNLDGHFFEEWYHGKEEYCVSEKVTEWTPLP